MLSLQNFPFTIFPDFAIEFDNETLTTGGSAEAIINEDPGANALTGSDVILGSLRANVETSDVVDLAGIRNLATFVAGPGSDWLIGAVRVDAENGSNILAMGIDSQSLIDMGPGNDRVIGTVHATVGDDVEFRGFAILSSRFDAIDTGPGRDSVIGTLKVKAGDDLDLIQPSAGIIGRDIDTGAGSDKVLGTFDVTAGARAVLTNDAGVGANLRTGDGNDRVVGTAKVAIGDDSLAFSTRGVSNTIETEGGRDKVIGTTIVSVGEDSVGARNAGILGRIDTGDGADKVIGKVSVTGEAGSSLDDNSGIAATSVVTGDGNDRVEGTSSIKGNDLQSGFGNGIGDAFASSRTVVDAGDGNDTVIGKGAEIALGGTSNGIVDADILLGAGDDILHARGASAGVRDVFIFGDEGNDTFDLHSGTGEVDGGEGDFDLLILSGDKDDFSFTAGPPDTGNIAGGVTDLDVANIELFEFDDGTFTYGELF